MAETKQELIIEINVSGSTEQLAKLRQELDVLIARRQDLSERSKAGDQVAVKETERVSSAIRNLQVEYKAQQRVLDGYTNTVKNNTNTSNLAANSIQQNRDLLKQLTAQYINLKNPSENATAQIKHLSDVLKEQEFAIGNTSRNVGNYAESFKQAFAEVGLSSNAAFGAIQQGSNIAKIGFKLAQETATGIKDSFNNLKGTVNGVISTQQAYAKAQETATIATEAVTQAQNNATKIGFKYAESTATLNEVEAANVAVTEAAAVETEALAASQVAASEATLATAGATKILKGALAASGIGLFILAIAATVEGLKRLNGVVDGFGDTMSGLSASFDTFVGSSALDKAKVFFGFVTPAMKASFEAGKELSFQLRELAKAQDANTITIAQNNLEVDELLLKSKDRTKSDKERIALLDEASAKESANLKTTLGFAVEKAALDKQALEAKKKANISSDNELKAANSSAAEVIRLENESNNLQERITTRRNQLILDSINSEVALLESAAAIQIARGTATANSLINIERTKNAKLLENVGLTEKERENLIAQSGVKIQQITEQFANANAAARIKAEEITAERAKLTGQDITGILIDIENKRRELLLNNIKLSALERENIVKDSENKISKIRVDAANKNINDLIKAEELLAEDLKRSGQDATATLIDIEMNRRTQSLSTLQAGTQAYENVVLASEQRIQQIKLDSAKQQQEIQLQAQDIALTSFENAESFRIESTRKANTLTTNQEIESSRNVAARRIEVEKNKGIALLNNTALNEQQQQNVIAQTTANVEKIKQDQSLFEIDIEKQKAQQIAEVVFKSAQQIMQVATMVTDLIIANSQQEVADAKEKNNQKQVDLKRQLDAGLISKKEFNKQSFESDQALREKERDEKRKQWEIAKGIQIANAVIQTAQAVLAAYSSGAAYPFVGPATGAAFAAIAAVLGAIQIGVISAQQPPKFAKGVIGIQGTGTDTSDSIPAYISKGESVVTAKATRRYHRELHAMEMSVGNVPNYEFGKGHFSTGFIPTVVSGDGGFTARDIQRQSSQLDTAALVNAIARIPAPVLSLVELNNKQASRDRSISVSEA